jgi:tRNA A37 N6-isopentenylltransferase MiaA
MPAFDSVYDCVQIGLDRADLDDRVAERVRRMMVAGFLDEVRGLLPAGLRDSPTAGKALGYAQLLDCLDDAGSGSWRRWPASSRRRSGPPAGSCAASARGSAVIRG